MTDTQLTYLDTEERNLIESIEKDPRLGRPLDPKEEREIREMLKAAAQRKLKDRKIISPDQLQNVFGTTGATPEAAARHSNRRFVRGRAQISPFDRARNPQGRVISAFEAFKAYGFDVLDEAVEYGAALLLQRHNAAGEAMRRQREALGLDYGAVSRRTKVAIETLDRIESGAADDISIATIERIAFVIGLDESQLSFRPDLAGGAIAGKLKTLQTRSPGLGLSSLTPKSVTTLAEAASVIRTQSQLQESLGLSGEAGSFDPVDDYGNAATPAWKIGYRLAREIREKLGMEADPVASMREFVESTLGIPVVQAELPRSIAGATIAAPDSDNKSRRGIVLNTTGANENPLVRRATLAHEVGHLLFDSEQRLETVRVDSYAGLAGNPEQPGSVDYVEQRANAFAISFLAPAESVRTLVEPPLSESDVAATVTRFGISLTAAQFHIKNAYSMDYPIPIATTLPIDENKWRAVEDYGVDYFPIEATPILRRGRFSGLVVAAWRQRLLSIDTAASYLNCSSELLRARADTVQSMHPANGF